MPKGVRRSMLSLCLVIQRIKRVTPLGLCLSAIVNQKNLHFEKPTSSSIYINLWYGIANRTP